jgi:hypothetical protein
VTEKSFRAKDKTLSQWREAGEDRNSILTDADIFADAEKGDFQLKDPALAKKVGFEPFDLKHAGVRKE